MRESRVVRGRRRGRVLVQRALAEIRAARMGAGVSQRTMARHLGWSQARYWRFESASTPAALEDVAMAAALLGLELGMGLHPVGDPVRDKGQQAVAKRFESLLADAWRKTREAPVTGTDWRAWDLLLRLASEVDGVDFETRFTDIQALVRRTRLRERDGSATHILLVGADTRSNRYVADQLREALGQAYRTSPRRLLSALREGQPLPGSGVLLV